ncbi:DUF4381 domain-containing protein [Endozoicomonas sp. Mp262]|uniref:DUF4381 domain-containing protein n=1 Tax=Endozoicomonas sp. Mp262 TaxID=2919499 RepID=UPI0021D8B29D
MDQTSLLDQLRPNLLPEPVSYWPPAMGWWLIAILLITGIAVAATFLVRHYRKNRYRRHGLRKVQAIYQSYLNHQQKRQFAHDCNRLLKAVALQAFPRQKTAQLNGQPWLDFLYESSGNGLFKQTAAAALGAERFKPDQEPDVELLHTLTKSWIKKHHA